jgi:hypothetical protein
MLKIKKISASAVIFALILMELSPLTLQAASFALPDSLVDSLTNPTTNTVVNSASNDSSGSLGKNSIPKVEVAFDSLNATKIGGKMIATANPGFFNNGSDPSRLYFTWYLKKNGCDKRSNVAEGDNCDLDKNHKIDENDWKIAAAKINVASSFDNTGVSYNNFANGENSDTAGYTAIPEINKSKNSTNIGWRNGFLRDSGGDLYQDNDDGSDVMDCYAQATASGRLYELRQVSSNFNNQCPTGYHRACVSDQTASCNVYNALNPAYRENFGACAVASENSDNGDVVCSVKDDTDLKNFKATVACKTANQLSVCVENDSATPLLSLNLEFGNITEGVLGIILGTKLGTSVGVDDTLNNKMCNAVAKPDPLHTTFFLANTNPLIGVEAEKCSTVRAGVLEGKKDLSGNTVILAKSELEPKCNFEKSANLCKHLFPVLPSSVKTDNNKQAVSGDGEFNLKEKEFWGADPAKANTVGKGRDEERVVGLGVNTFAWTYSAGDEVGVAVEGESIYPTNHADAAYKRMWAFSKGTCKVLDEAEKSKTINSADPTKNTRGFYLDGNTGILTAEVDLNDCLEENLLDPRENDLTDGKSQLGIEMVSVPQNPINDASGKGDILTVSTTAYNSQDYNNLVYTWTVQISRGGSAVPTDETTWKDITTELKAVPSFSAADTVGINKNKLEINLNLPETLIKNNITGTLLDTFYLRIRAKIKGTATDGGQGADQYTIVKVRQQQKHMGIFPVVANNKGLLSMDNSSGGAICSTDSEKVRCYVTKNEIIGLNIPNEGTNLLTNFAWKVNGSNITCDAEVSAQCTVGGNTMFVPILGNEGEAVDVTATAINAATNEAVEISRHFVIIKPQAIISSIDSAATWPKLLGYYKDLDGNRSPDYSKLVFEAQEGGTVKLAATFYPASIESRAGFDWLIDGEIQYDLSGKKEIAFPISKLAGESYNISLVANYNVGPESQLNNLRKALLKNWNVSPEDSIEEQQSVNIQINVLAGSQIGAAKNTQKGVASLIAHLPENLIFLLNIVLTSGMLLLATGVIFAVMPAPLFKREEN